MRGTDLAALVVALARMTRGFDAGRGVLGSAGSWLFDRLAVGWHSPHVEGTQRTELQAILRPAAAHRGRRFLRPAFGPPR